MIFPFRNARFSYTEAQKNSMALIRHGVLFMHSSVLYSFISIIIIHQYCIQSMVMNWLPTYPSPYSVWIWHHPVPTSPITVTDVPWGRTVRTG